MVAGSESAIGRGRRPPEPHLVLVGLMGAGKSTVGAECGRRLGRSFIDIDRVIEENEGVSVAELFSTRGEAVFRDRERDTIEGVLAAADPCVVAPGGGAVLDPEIRDALSSQGVVVWLQAPVAVLAERVGDGGGRPLLDHNPADTLHRLEKEREQAYRDVADVAISSAHVSVRETTDAVLAAYATAVEPRGEAGCSA